MRITLTALILTLLLWSVSLSSVDLQGTFLFWRGQLTQITGILAIALMGMLLLMAVRPRWLEQKFGGLDKMYKAHKAVGISAGVVVILHWLVTKSPKFLTTLDLIQLGPRPPRHGVPDPFRGFFESLGEYAFYAMLLLIIFSLVKKVPYRYFKIVHKAGAVIGLLAVAHSMYMMNSTFNWTALGIFNIAVSTFAGICILLSLSGRVGANKKYEAELVSFRALNPTVTEVELQVSATFFDLYKPGMFAFITFNRKEGGHPFTLVDADPNSCRIKFAIKALGDYTKVFTEELKLGMPVKVEGPYGKFKLPEVYDQQQVWVGAGIGITPFIAWLNDLNRRQVQYKNATLYYAVSHEDDLVYKDELAKLAKKVGIELVIHQSDKQGFMKFEQFKSTANSKFWFCGPVAMRNMIQNHIPKQQLHYEFFDFR